MDDWKECLSENAVITSSVDNQKVKSLIKISKGRISYLNKQELLESDINYIFEGYYTSILELIHSLTISKGFKVKNNICIGYYLRDKLNELQLYNLFDDLRYKRNSLVYYGKSMDFDIAKEAIDKSKNLLNKLDKL